MSRDVKVQFSVTNMDVMKRTLTQMGIAFNESSESQLQISRKYHNIVFNQGAQTTCDDMDQKFVNGIAQNYTLNCYKEKALKEGINLKEERLASGQIVLTCGN